MAGTIFVTGGSGFVGSAVIDDLLGRDYAVRALVNCRPMDARGGRIQTVRGDLFNTAALDEGMKGCQAVIHLVGIIFEKPGQGVTFERIHAQGARNVVDAAIRNAVRRFVHMSSLGSRPNAVSRYHRTKYEAEQYLRGSGLDWTIFRPSVIHGPGGEFMKMEAKWVHFRAPPFLFMPYFGAGPLGTGGAGRLQPVYVKDVAKAFVDALENPKTIGEVYPIGGNQQVTWPQLHRIVATAIRGKPRWVMPIPVAVAKAYTYLIPGAILPFNMDQVIMSQEDNTCDVGKFKDDFGWEPGGFEESLATYARQL